jgi:hypothetical protein
MNLGLRGILLAVAILLFVIAVFSNPDTWLNLVAWGLAAVAAALLVEELGLATRINVGGGTRNQP